MSSEGERVAGGAGGSRISNISESDGIKVEKYIPVILEEKDGL